MIQSNRVHAVLTQEWRAVTPGRMVWGPAAAEVGATRMLDHVGDTVVAAYTRDSADEPCWTSCEHDMQQLAPVAEEPPADDAQPEEEPEHDDIDETMAEVTRLLRRLGVDRSEGRESRRAGVHPSRRWSARFDGARWVRTLTRGAAGRWCLVTADDHVVATIDRVDAARVGKRGGIVYDTTRALYSVHIDDGSGLHSIGLPAYLRAKPRPHVRDVQWWIETLLRDRARRSWLR